MNQVHYTPSGRVVRFPVVAGYSLKLTNERVTAVYLRTQKVFHVFTTTLDNKQGEILLKDEDLIMSNMQLGDKINSYIVDGDYLAGIYVDRNNRRVMLLILNLVTGESRTFPGMFNDDSYPVGFDGTTLYVASNTKQPKPMVDIVGYVINTDINSLEFTNHTDLKYYSRTNNLKLTRIYDGSKVIGMTDFKDIDVMKIPHGELLLSIPYHGPDYVIKAPFVVTAYGLIYREYGRFFFRSFQGETVELLLAENPYGGPVQKLFPSVASENGDDLWMKRVKNEEVRYINYVRSR